MKNRLLSLCLICAFLHTINLTAQNKVDLIWMHGMNGESSGTSYLNNHPGTFDDYSNFDYAIAPTSNIPTSYSGIDLLTDSLSTQINAETDIGNDEVIFIGHSLGGLLGRELDVRHSEGVANGLAMRGIITMGSPLDGAKIANSLRSQFHRKWVYGWGSAVNRFIISTVYNMNRYEPFEGLMSAAEVMTLNTLTGVLSLAVGLGKNSSDKTLFSGIAPISGQSWHDLKVGGYNITTGTKSTPTPKINIWGSVPSPLFETMIKSNGQEKAYKDYLNKTEFMYNYYRSIPNMGIMVRETSKAHTYMKFTINGRYANLISNGVTYTTKMYDIRTKESVQTCHQQAVQQSGTSCRKWGWFKWICKPFVYFVTVVICKIEAVFITHTYNYKFPHYNKTDGLISAASAKGENTQWKGIEIEVVDAHHHNGLIDTSFNSNKTGDHLNKIFRGTHPALNQHPAIKAAFKID